MKKSRFSPWLMALAALSLIKAAEAEVGTPVAAPAGSAKGNYEEEFSGVRDFSRIVNDLNCETAETNKIGFDKQSCDLIKWIKKKGVEYKLCKQFFSDDKGKLGPYGKAIASLVADDIVRNQKDSVFMQDNHDTKKSCPGFKHMTPMQKVAFHTWVWELTALPESTCNAEVKDNTSSDVPQGQAVCLYQLEYPKATREWRSSSPSKTNAIDPKTGKRKKYCAVPESEIRTLEGCTGCAFDDYKRHFMATGYLFGEYSDGPTPKRLHAAQWAAQNRLNEKQTEEVLAYVQCREANKCPKNTHMNEKLAAHDYFKRLERFPLCKTKAANEELAKLSQ